MTNPIKATINPLTIPKAHLRLFPLHPYITQVRQVSDTEDVIELNVSGKTASINFNYAKTVISFDIPDASVKLIRVIDNFFKFLRVYISSNIPDATVFPDIIETLAPKAYALDKKYSSKLWGGDVTYIAVDATEEIVLTAVMDRVDSTTLSAGSSYPKFIDWDKVDTYGYSDLDSMSCDDMIEILEKRIAVLKEIKNDVSASCGMFIKDETH